MSEAEKCFCNSYIYAIKQLLFEQINVKRERTAVRSAIGGGDGTLQITENVHLHGSILESYENEKENTDVNPLPFESNRSIRARFDRNLRESLTCIGV